MTFARDRHEHVDGAGNRSQRCLRRRPHAQTEILNVHRQLNHMSRQIFIQEQFLTGTVRDSDPPMRALNFEAVTEQSERLTSPAGVRLRRPELHGRRISHSLAQTSVTKGDRSLGCERGWGIAQSLRWAGQCAPGHRRILNHQQRVARCARGSPTLHGRDPLWVEDNWRMQDRFEWVPDIRRGEWLRPVEAEPFGSILSVVPRGF